MLLGAHGRRRSGLGDEFWQYRPLSEADEAREIDWRRSAKSDVHFIRQKEWQAAQSVVRIANTGDVTLTNLVISHSRWPACDEVVPVLPVGAIYDHVCDVPNAQADWEDVITVVADGEEACSTRG